jgi:hypothetical protein
MTSATNVEEFSVVTLLKQIQEKKESYAIFSYTYEE